LNIACGLEEVTVWVGNATCKVNSLDDVTLYCSPPPITRYDVLPTVTVRAVFVDSTVASTADLHSVVGRRPFMLLPFDFECTLNIFLTYFAYLSAIISPSVCCLYFL